MSQKGQNKQQNDIKIIKDFKPTKGNFSLNIEQYQFEQYQLSAFCIDL